LRSANRWITPVAVLAVVVVCTIAFTVHNVSDGKVAGARATGTAAPVASSTSLPSSTRIPPTRAAVRIASTAPTRTPSPMIATRVPRPANTLVPVASATPLHIGAGTPISFGTPLDGGTSTVAPTYTAVPLATGKATSVPIPTSTLAIVGGPVVQLPQAPHARDSTTTAAIILAAMQLGYTPPAADPTVRAFAQDLTVLQPMCKIGMTPLAYQIAHASAVLQRSGMSGSLLDTATRLRQFVSNTLPGDRIVIGSCPGLFDAYTRSLTDIPGAQADNGGHGDDSDKYGGKVKHAKHGKK
jgi:hypothetical protein